MEAFAREGKPLTVQAISDWRNLKHGVPPTRVAIVAEVLGLMPHQVRPDIFSPPKNA